MTGSPRAWPKEPLQPKPSGPGHPCCFWRAILRMPVKSPNASKNAWTSRPLPNTDPSQGHTCWPNRSTMMDEVMAHLLGAEALHFEYPTQKVLESVTMGVSAGDRIGIVGRNGDGKSTLMKLLVGQLEPDAGQVTVRSDVTIGMLDQSDTINAALTVGQAIVGDLAEHEWASDPKIRDVIRGLVSDLDWNVTVSSLSGGQRRRVALARLLIGDWDILALDEPTNHLDVEGIAWLADHLNRRWADNAGGLLVITHDRWFLDAVCNQTWEVHDGIVESFEGGYAAYVLQRVERDRMAAAAEAKRQNLMRKELAWLRRGAPARTAKPKFRVEAATQLIEDEIGRAHV